MSIGFNALTTITGVLKGDKLLKTSHHNFQFVVQRDTTSRLYSAVRLDLQRGTECYQKWQIYSVTSGVRHHYLDISWQR